MLVVQPLPSSLFADPEQLRELKRFGSIEVWADPSVDIEAPSRAEGSQSAKRAAADVVFSRCCGTFPVHFRYQPPGSSAYHTAVLPRPCLVRAKEGAEVADWVSVSIKGKGDEHQEERESNQTTASIPVGLKDYSEVVSIVTHIMTTGGAIVIILLATRSQK